MWRCSTNPLELRRLQIPLGSPRRRCRLAHVRYREPAICLRTTDYSETSQVVHFLARAGRGEAAGRGFQAAQEQHRRADRSAGRGEIVFSAASHEALATLIEFSQTALRQPAKGVAAAQRGPLHDRAVRRDARHGRPSPGGVRPAAKRGWRGWTRRTAPSRPCWRISSGDCSRTQACWAAGELRLLRRRDRRTAGHISAPSRAAFCVASARVRSRRNILSMQREWRD